MNEDKNTTLRDYELVNVCKRKLTLQSSYEERNWIFSEIHVAKLQEVYSHLLSTAQQTTHHLCYALTPYNFYNISVYLCS